ncbi:hypothetical protein MLD38_019708 [Melastoma candidum]|uniref:Uncharacterized protein n=1 Tax=Melastoma candidum TaxID=119954 RepID=A0ACB9QZ48_9MYRT|nr:hypothetical protein MLD38_019708 [Melastoma candidum]
MDSVAVRRHCYSHEDDGLASLADMEAGNNFTNININNKLYCHSICHSTQICSPRGGFRSRPYGSPISGRFHDARWPEEEEEERRQPHFLEACFRCRKQLGNNRDIFMYGGDTAFCSEECRQEQIDMDESKEKRKKKINPSSSSSSSSMKALRKKQQESTNRDYKAFCPGAVAAA